MPAPKIEGKERADGKKLWADGETEASGKGLLQPYPPSFFRDWCDSERIILRTILTWLGADVMLEVCETRP